MSRFRDERGVTLIELLVAMVMSAVLLGAVVLLFGSFMKDNSYAAYRDDAQAHAQTMVDRLSRDLRTAASINAGSSGLLETAGSYDMVFQTVNATPGSPPSSNASNQQWVRYCLDSNDTLWRQTTTPANTTSSEPDTSACPSTNSVWTQVNGSPCCTELTDVTNEIGGDNRPLFTYGPTGYASTSDVKSVEITLYVDRNPGHLPGPTELTSGVYLRNELAPPVANFTPNDKAIVSGSKNDITLDGSSSSDPNGQVLSYQWYEGNACPSLSGVPSGAIAGATAQQYDAGDFTPGQTVTFALVVTNTGGLTNCYSQVVTV